MTKRILGSPVTFAIATALLATPAFAQAPASPATPPAPVPMTSTPVPAPVPAAAVPAAPAAAAATTPAPRAAKATKPTHAQAATKAKPAAAEHTQRIERLQTALNANGAKLKVDGKMGPKTHAALVAFQKAHGLKANGHLDKETIAALKAAG